MRDLIKRILLEERTVWTKEMIQKEADRFSTIHDFRINSRKAYRFAEKRGWLPEITKNLDKSRKTKYPLDYLKKLVSQYEYLSDFIKNHPKETNSLRGRGLFDELTKNLKRGLTKDEVAKIAFEFNTKSEFEQGNPTAYNTARYHGWYDEVTKHMKTLGNLMNRAVYVWEFPDNSVYVGLTYNIDRRSAEHLNLDGKTAVAKHIRDTQLTPKFMQVSQGYIGAENAANMEECLINDYRSKGWKILNNKKAGGLGGCKLKYSKEDFIDIISKYTDLTQFRKENRDLVAALERYGWYEELTKELYRKKKYWTDDEILDVASKYETLKDFRENEPKAFSVAKNRKLKLPLTTQRTLWTFEKTKEEAKKYINKNEFRNKNQSAFNSAYRNNWLNLFFPND